jgi:hypothetical protein
MWLRELSMHIERANMLSICEYYNLYEYAHIDIILCAKGVHVPSLCAYVISIYVA